MLEAIALAAASAGGMAMVQAAGTDSWAWCRTRCARLVGRGDDRRERDALDQLDRTAVALADAADEEDLERLRSRHARLWEGEFASLLEALGVAERDRAVAELDALAKDFGSPDTPGGNVVSGFTFHGQANVQIGDGNTQEIQSGSA